MPILIAGGLIAMPFSQDRETSLWNMVARVVAVIFFIAISQPLFGFLIEASNAVTNALAPPTFVLTFNVDLDTHPLNVFDQRMDHLVAVLDALTWENELPTVPARAVQ